MCERIFSRITFFLQSEGALESYAGRVLKIPQMTELWLIRHGESEGNASGTIQGHNDSPLSQLGRRQAAALAERMRREGRFDAIYSSDLARARQTARPTAEVLGLPLNEIVGLREIDLGLWSGLTRTEIERRFPDEWARWKRFDTQLRRGGAESYADLQARIVAVVEEIVARHRGERVILVFHAGAIKSYLAYVLRLPLSEMWRLDISNASISRVRMDTAFVDPDRVAPGRLLTLNDTCHLEGLR